MADVLSLSPGLLLLGDSESLSSTVLMLLAISAASDLNLRVLMFRPAPIASLQAPVQRALSALNPHALKMIEFRYPRTLEELLQQLASLHCVPTPPAVVLVDGWESYVCAGPQVLRMAALLMDTCAFLTQRLTDRTDSAHCRVILGVDSGSETNGPDPLLAVLERYFPARCKLESVVDASSDVKAWRIYFSKAEADVSQVWRLELHENGATQLSISSP